MQDQSHPPVDWSAVAWVNGLRYLVATVLVGLFGLVLSGNLTDGLNWALMALVFYGLNLALLLTLRLKYVELFQRFVNGFNRAIDRGFRSFLSFEGGPIVAAFRFMGFLLLLVFYILFVILGVAPAFAHPILYVLKRAGLLSRLPEGFPLFVWSFFLMVEAGEAPPQAEPAAPATRAAAGEKIKAIATRPTQDCAFLVTESGEVYAWGRNERGILGLGDEQNRPMPTKVPGLAGIKAIAAGNWHFLALTESGEVYGWGDNRFGQLGLGDTENRLMPAKVPGLAGIKAIAAGVWHSLALTESGEIYGWGDNRFGQLGLGDTENRLMPAKVSGLAGVKAIATGYWYSLALTESGEVYEWGYAEEVDEWGLGEFKLPVKVPGLAGIKAIATGTGPERCCFAVTESGEVYAWGENETGLLGLGDREKRLTPTKVPGLVGVKAVFPGSRWCFAVTESGEIYIWGDGKSAADLLGLGDREKCLTPTKVPGLARVKSIAEGEGFILALTESGEIYIWGRFIWAGELVKPDDWSCYTKPTKLPYLPLV